MNKKTAKTPPMGWNSWDCYGASVTEAEVLANAKYMAENMKQYGWDYVVVDIEWYEPTANDSYYHPFMPLEMDQYGRLIPAPNRFPSSAGAKGFAPLAAQIHDMGLKFGIHILRGIPRQAVHADMPIAGSDLRARGAASRSSICPWNTCMYGLDMAKPGGQDYYDSIFALYAEWGVDFVKVDDLSSPYYDAEIEGIRRAIDKSGREMVLSTSPGPAPAEKGAHLCQNANMWRVINDFWDDWGQVGELFERYPAWAPYIGEGHWPDADMLPLGRLSVRGSERGLGDRMTRFSRDEQITVMTLWNIVRSPLMMGGDLPSNDEWTLSLLTNEEVLNVGKTGEKPRQVLKQPTGFGEFVVWASDDTQSGGLFLALFNTTPGKDTFSVPLDALGLSGAVSVRDLWANEELGQFKQRITAEIASHGARLLSVEPE